MRKNELEEVPKIITNFMWNYKYQNFAYVICVYITHMAASTDQAYLRAEVRMIGETKINFV